MSDRTKPTLGANAGTELRRAINRGLAEEGGSPTLAGCEIVASGASHEIDSKAPSPEGAVTPELVQHRMAEMARTLRAMEAELAWLLERMPEHASYRDEVGGMYDENQSLATTVRAHLVCWSEGGHSPLRDAAEQLEETAEEREPEGAGS
jgi:hypothetical protein